MKPTKLLRCALLLALCLMMASTPALANVADDVRICQPGTYPKFDPPIDLHAVGSLASYMQYPEGIDQYDNVWKDAYLEELGINLIWDWLTETDYEAKLNVQIASNNLPDIFLTNTSQLKVLEQNEQIWDLAQVYQEHGSDITKRQMEMDDYGFKTAWINGKLMGLPIISSTFESANLLWLRQDWLEALGLPEPTTMQDALAIAEAFTKQDPDGNGMDDTYGLAVANDLYNLTGTYVYSLQGFFNGYHAYPSAWIDDGTGKITYGSLQPQVREALLTLQQMYADGLIDPTFGVKDKNGVVEDTTAGTVGMEYGYWWNTDWPLSMCRANIPTSDWKAYMIPSVDAEPARPLVRPSVNEYLVVSKGFEHPEAVITMLNLFEDVYFTEDEAVYNKYIVQENEDGTSYEWHRLAVVMNYDVNQNPSMCYNVSEALETGDTSKLTLEQQTVYSSVKKYVDGDEDNTIGYRDFRRYTLKDGAYGQLLNYVEGRSPIEFNQYYQPNTDLMAAKLPALDKMEYEIMTRIIMGDSIELFDRFVEDWMALGGAEILDEMNEWYTSK